MSCPVSPGPDALSAPAVTILLPVPPRKDATGRDRPQTLTSHCRALIADGTDPASLVSVYRDGTLCFKPMLLGVWAALTTEERDDRSIRWARYKPRPDGLSVTATA